MCQSVLLVPGDETEININLLGIRFQTNAPNTHVIISSYDGGEMPAMSLDSLRAKINSRELAVPIRQLYQAAIKYAESQNAQPPSSLSKLSQVPAIT